MFKNAIGLFAVSMVCLLPVAAGAQLAPYAQNFEGLDPANAGALSGDGWLVFGNVFDSSGGYLYGYGVFPAPNNYDAPAFSLLASGEGDGSQGLQQLLILNDYNNTDHAIGNIIEANVFQEQVVGASDVGMTWYFDFDAKRGDLAGSMTALAFIKTLDPNAGFATTNFITLDMTTTPQSWNNYVMSIAIDASLEGQILQFGFSTTGTNYDPSGVFYDNIQFVPEGTVTTESRSFGAIKAQYD